MSTTLIIGEFKKACKLIHKSFSPYSLSLYDEKHEDNIELTKKIFSNMEQVNTAFLTGGLLPSDLECSLIRKEKGLNYKETVYFAPVVAYGKMPFVLQRLQGEPYLAMFDIVKRQEQYCPKHIKSVIRKMAIDAARDDIHLDPQEMAILILQKLANDENPHLIPKIHSEKRSTYILNAKENILWMKQDGSSRQVMSIIHKLMHRITAAFEDSDYASSARLRSSYDGVYSDKNLNVKFYSDYASVEKTMTAGGFNVQHVVEHLSKSTADINDLDITYTAQLTDKDYPDAKTSFKNALKPFLEDIEVESNNKFLQLVIFADDKNMDISEVVLEIALEADKDLSEYVEQFNPMYLSDIGLGPELTSYCKVGSAKGNMKIELTNSSEIKSYIQGICEAFINHNADEVINIVRGEQLTLNMIGNLTGMLLSSLQLYIDLFHKTKAIDGDFGKTYERYESQRKNG